jgi:hypothetical protein
MFRKIVSWINRRRDVEREDERRDERWSDKDVVGELKQLERLLVEQQKEREKQQRKLTDAVEDAAEDTIKAIKHSTDAIVAAIQGSAPPEKAVSANLTYTLIGGTMPGNTLSGAPGNTATPTFTEAAADGTSVAPIGPVIYASDNTAVATVDAAGIMTLVAGGSANVSALDQGNGLSDSVAVTVTAVVPVATSASLSYSLNPARRR